MRKYIITALMIVSVLIAGCKNREEEFEKEISKLTNKVKRLNTQHQNDLEATEDAENRVSGLKEQLSDLKKEKDLTAAEFIGKPKFEIKNQDFAIYFSGTVKNTGKVALNNVSVKVTFRDKYKNTLELKIVGSTVKTIKKMEFFHNVLDYLAEGESKDFEMKIHTQYLFGGGDAIKKSIAEWRNSGKQVKVAITWGSVKSFIK